MNRSLRAFPHRLHRAANVKERPFTQCNGLPLSYVRGSVLAAVLPAQYAEDVVQGDAPVPASRGFGFSVQRAALLPSGGGPGANTTNDLLTITLPDETQIVADLRSELRLR